METPEFTSSSESSQAEQKEVIVVRDGTFTRAIADEVNIFELGRDIELCFLQYGSEISSRFSIKKDGSDEDVEGFNLRPVITEVSRIRIAHGPAIALALGLLDSLSGTGKVNKGAIEKAFSAILEKIEASSDER